MLFSRHAIILPNLSIASYLGVLFLLQQGYFSDLEHRRHCGLVYYLCDKVITRMLLVYLHHRIQLTLLEFCRAQNMLIFSFELGPASQ